MPAPLQSPSPPGSLSCPSPSSQSDHSSGNGLGSAPIPPWVWLPMPKPGSQAAWRPLEARAGGHWLSNRADGSRPSPRSQPLLPHLGYLGPQCSLPPSRVKLGDRAPGVTVARDTALSLEIHSLEYLGGEGVNHALLGTGLDAMLAQRWSLRESLGSTTGSGPLEEGLSASSGQNRHQHHSSAGQSFSGIIQCQRNLPEVGMFYTSPCLLEICLLSDPSPKHDPWKGSG